MLEWSPEEGVHKQNIITYTVFGISIQKELDSKAIDIFPAMVSQSNHDPDLDFPEGSSSSSLICSCTHVYRFYFNDR